MIQSYYCAVIAARVVVIATAVFGLVAVKLWSHVLDVDFRNSSEWQSNDKEYNDKMDKEAYDRAMENVKNGTDTEKDREVVLDNLERSS
jgi:hypothetical protein